MGILSLGELNVTQTIKGISSKAQTINYQKLLARIAVNSITGGVIGGVDAFLGDEDLEGVIESIGIGAVSGMVLGVFAQFNAIKPFLCSIGCASLIAGVNESFDNDRPGQACFRAIMCIAVAFSLCNSKSVTEVADNSKYHVTTSEAAKSIMASGELNKGRFENAVFAFSEQPTLSQAKRAGIGSKSQVVLKFKTNASFSPDTGVDKALQGIAIHTAEGTRYPVKITDVSEVGFKKAWWQFWGK